MKSTQLARVERPRLEQPKGSATTHYYLKAQTAKRTEMNDQVN